MIYVDKTKFIHKLISEGKYYFLSRPRRFGKSLLLTTLKAFFQGKKELFENLAISNEVVEWNSYPIIHIDYSLVDYSHSLEVFRESLLDHLEEVATEYDLQLEKTGLSGAFVELVKKLVRKFQKPVVVLVDDYDKPLIDSLGQENRFNENRAILRNLYGTIKVLDKDLRFVMLTGVSRLAKVGIFSGMNNLDDISMNSTFGGIVGFTQEELELYFQDYLNSLSDRFSMDKKSLMLHIQQWYNGFSFDGIDKLYNPFSILKLFTELEFRNYWFSTGTPTFLMDLIKAQKKLPESFEGIKVVDLTGGTTQVEKIPLIPLLYQTGYLTIAQTGRDGVRPHYYLNYPNEEVRHSFLTYVTATFLNKEQFDIEPVSLDLRTALINNDINQFVIILQQIFSDIPSRLHIPKEAYYHSLAYLLLKLIGANIILERETDKGRIDAVIELSDKIFIVEFKFSTNKRVKQVNTLAQNALKQIKDKKYYEAYGGKKKKVIMLGLGYLNKEVAGIAEEM